MHTHKQGFTLIEVLVVAPMVILSIGAFIALIITLTGNTLASRAASALQHDTQSAIAQIDEDVRRSVAFLAVNDIAFGTANPQGYTNTPSQASSAGSTVNFTNVNLLTNSGSQETLILKQLATTKNPIANGSDVVYQANTPNPCTGNYRVNTPVYINIMYFVAEGSLWKRTVTPTNYATSGVLCGATATYQLPSCGSGTTHTYCKAKDTLLVKNISPEQFSFTYFASIDSATPNLAASNPSSSNITRNAALSTNKAIEIQLTPSGTASGRDISAKATLRTERLNSLP